MAGKRKVSGETAKKVKEKKPEKADKKPDNKVEDFCL